MVFKIKTPYTSFLLLILIITAASIQAVHSHSHQCQNVWIQVSPNQEAMVVTRANIGENKVKGRKMLGIKNNAFNVNDEEEKMKNNNKNSDASGGFVVVNGDYHSPRHHPPKNN